MKVFEFFSKSPAETTQLARRISRFIKKGDIFCLEGELGSGKTTFVKGIAGGLKFSPEKVISPTFVLMNIYQGRLPIYHFDLYRLETEEMIRGIGCDEFFYSEGVSLVEWAERLKGLRPEEYLLLKFHHDREQTRRVRLEAVGARYRDLLKNVFHGKILT